MTETATIPSLPPISYQLTADISLTTTVEGTARSIATVQIFYATEEIWTATLTEADSMIATQWDLAAGHVIVKKGAFVVLAVPSEIEDGSISLVARLFEPPDHHAYMTPVIATWPLTGPVSSSSGSGP